MKSSHIFWIGSWANTIEKQERTLNNLRRLKSIGVDVGLVTHYPDITWVEPGLVDYLILENYNEIPDSYDGFFSIGFSNLKPCCWRNSIECNGLIFEKRLAIGLQTFPILRSISHAATISKNCGYKTFGYAEEDFQASDQLLNFLSSSFSKVADHNYEFLGFESYTTSGGINPCLFLSTPDFVSKNISLEMLKDVESFHLNFPNRITEDVLFDLCLKTNKSIILDSKKIEEVLGEYGIGWDISHLGFSWAKSPDKKTLNSLCSNFPYLRRTRDNHYSLDFLMRQEMVEELLFFSAKIYSIKSQEKSLIFDKTAELNYNWWMAWNDVVEIYPSSGSFLLIETKIKSSTSEIFSSFQIELESEELDGFHRIFNSRKI